MGKVKEGVESEDISGGVKRIWRYNGVHKIEKVTTKESLIQCRSKSQKHKRMKMGMYWVKGSGTKGKGRGEKGSVNKEVEKEVERKKRNGVLRAKKE